MNFVVSGQTVRFSEIHLIFVRPPFQGKTQQELNDRIKEGRFQRLPSSFSQLLNDTLRSMLAVDVGCPSSSTDILYQLDLLVYLFMKNTSDQ
jgi:hypothetical protein